ncbi:MAG: HigA family addiction module antitoxin [Fibrobacterota bacterium]
MITDYISDLAIAPGEYLEEVLEEFGMSQAELALRMGRPQQAINEIIKGKKQITPETALQLEQVLGVTASMWNNLEAEYRLVLAKKMEQEKDEAEQKWIPYFPYIELSKLGLVKTTRNRLEKVQQLKSFFGVSSLSNIKNVKEYAPAFRKSNRKNVSEEALASWLRAGHMIAVSQDLPKFDTPKLQNSLEQIKNLTFESNLNQMMHLLKKTLNSCGVAFIMLPHFKKTYVTGATFWISQRNPVIIMSNRGEWSDIFWFSLMHEIGHVLLHDKKTTFIERNSNKEKAKKEAEADNFAKTTLIPSKEYKEFTSKHSFTKNSIHAFSKVVKIHPGIVTGRLQHDELLPYSITHFKTMFKWGRE